MLHDILSTRHRLLQEMSLISKIIGERINNHIATNQTESATNDLKGLAHKPSIELGCIYTSEGTFFSHYTIGENNLTCPQKAPEFYHDFSWNHFYLHQPIPAAAGEKHNSIFVISNLDDIYHQLWRSLLITFITVSITMMLALFVISRLKEAISRPILHLVDVTNMIAKRGDYGRRVRKFFNDEVGSLTDSFNQMMSEIQDANENLELKIKNRTKELQTAKERAENANVTKTEFLRNISHEFRTPLHAMSNFSLYGINEIETASKEELLGYFSRIQNASGRLLKLVETLLALAKLEKGKVYFAIKKNNLRTLLETALEESQSLLRQSNITVKIEEFDEKLLTIACDGDRIMQVLSNLIGNAIKFSPKSSTLHISFSSEKLPNMKGRKSNNAIGLTIRDSGIGIPETELLLIFDKFVQSSRTRTGAGGTGLGLAIARDIVRGHDGDLYAGNNDDQGAFFTMVLPTNLEIGKKLVELD